MRVEFFSPTRSTFWVARRSGLTGWAALLLSTFPGRAMWAAYLRHRVPAQAARLRWRARRARQPVAWTTMSPERSSFRAAALVVAGPGEHDALSELVDSIHHYEGGDIKIVLADDATGQYPDDLVRHRFPGVDVVRASVPGGNASCSFRTQQLGFLHLLDHYDVALVLKLDPDSLIIGAGAFELAGARFAEDPGLGVLGTTDRNAAGAETDYRFTTWVAHPEMRWSRRLRRLRSRAQSGVDTVQFAQGGAYFVASRALAAAREQRLLPFAQPAWSLLTEDVVTDLIVQAAGFRVGSFGAPGEPIASATRTLPVEPQEALDLGCKVVHSVRGTPSGLSEAAVRSFFARQRAAAQSPRAERSR